MLFILGFLALLKALGKPKNLGSFWFHLAMVTITTGASLNAPVSGEDGGAFAVRQSAESQKEMDKLLSQDKDIASLRNLKQPTLKNSIQSLGRMKEQLDAIRTQGAQIVDQGSLINGLDIKKGCPSQLLNKGAENQGGCSSNSLQSSLFSKDADVSASEKKEQILVFVSFSMPEASLRALAQDAEQHNAVLVVRGLYEGSFVKTATKLKDVGVGVDINPELFEEYQITAAPTFVVIKNGQAPVKLKGNVSLGFVAQKVAEHHHEAAS